MHWLIVCRRRSQIGSASFSCVTWKSCRHWHTFSATRKPDLIIHQRSWHDCGKLYFWISSTMSSREPPSTPYDFLYLWLLLLTCQFTVSHPIQYERAPLRVRCAMLRKHPPESPVLSCTTVAESRSRVDVVDRIPVWWTSHSLHSWGNTPVTR